MRYVPAHQRRALVAFLAVVLTHSKAKLPAAETATYSKKQRVIVVGAGLAGLAAARALQAEVATSYC